MDWAFLRLFSADGLGLNLWKFMKKKLKNWKNYRSDAISEEKEGKKSREISVKFENLEKNE